MDQLDTYIHTYMKAYMYTCTGSSLSFPQFMFPNYYHHFYFLIKFSVMGSNRKLENEKHLPLVTTRRNAGCRVAPGMGSSNVMPQTRT